MKKYFKNLWNNVFVYAMLDFITAATFVVILFLLTEFLLYLGKNYLLIDSRSIKTAVIALGLLYTISILITSMYYHLRFLIKKESIKK